MQKAIDAVENKRMGWLLASKTYGVPQATLRRHALRLNKTLEPNSKGLGRFKLTFPLDVERQLVEHLKLLETRLFGLTRKEVQEIAFQLAEKMAFLIVSTGTAKKLAKNGYLVFLSGTVTYPCVNLKQLLLPEHRHLINHKLNDSFNRTRSY